MTWVAAAVVGSSLISGYMGSQAAKKGAQIQADSAKYATDVQKEMFDIQNQQYAPYRGAGYSALSQIRSMLPGSYTTYDETGKETGTATGTDYLTRGFTAEDFKASLDPSYAWRLGQGQEATNRMANLGGGAIGGNTLKAIQDYSQGLASTEYGLSFNRDLAKKQNIYNTLAGIAGIGQTAQGQTAQLASNTAGNVGQLAVGSAGAQAAGTVGAANAWGNALQGGTSGLMLSSLLRPGTVNTGANYGGYGGAGSVGNLNLPSYNVG